MAHLSLPAERERWCPDSYCLQLGIPADAFSGLCFFSCRGNNVKLEADTAGESFVMHRV